MTAQIQTSSILPKMRLKYFLLLCRPLNVLIGMLSIFMGAFIAGSLEPRLKVLLASLSGGVIAAAANAINDVYDVAIDRINKPQRPIAAGIISPREGYYFSMGLFGMGMVLGAAINWPAFVISLLSSILLFWYSAQLKRTVFWGNFVVSLVTALAFIYGGVAVSRFGYSLIPAVFSFFYHLGREIIKDTEDVIGDRADNAQTLPIRYGKTVALRAALWIYLTLILLTIVPYLLKIFGIYYLILVLGIVDAVIVYVLFSMFRRADAQNLSRLSLILKLNMFAGLVAIYVGRF
ncbi:MAG: geranylgeranylglycerol-phosphate geranylgeranyltransferase [candidate division KSB1 bacterium]|nr:geranylgeranylglycerol-phosphate geranylgeranyltransferase [candidate division KSB1 bacterium]MDZ7318513.1 geranylgeranylglycerol-phosphate geranylgeranyltransferase [candidate division KSB1 bacterium]